MLYSVAPLTRLPLTRNQTYSYLSDEEIPVGSLVSIPFGPRKIQGVVIASSPARGRCPEGGGGIKKSFHLKSISSIIWPSALTPEQLSLAQFLAHEYFTPLGITLKLFLPKRVKMRKKKDDSPSRDNPRIVPTEEHITLSREQQKALREIKKYLFQEENLLLCHSDRSRSCPSGRDAAEESANIKTSYKQETSSKKNASLIRSVSSADPSATPALSDGAESARDDTSVNEQLVLRDPRSTLREFYLYGPASSGKTEIYIKTIKELLKSKKFPPPRERVGGWLSNKPQILVLLPELTLTAQAIEHHKQRLGADAITPLHGKLSAGELFYNWEKIRSGEARVIIGSRMALFAPFKNLQLIVIDEEQDPSFKEWNTSPRYDARDVAQKIAQQHNALVLLGSAAPSLEFFQTIQSGEIPHATTPYYIPPKKKNFPKAATPPPREVVGGWLSEIKIINMREEVWKQRKKSRYAKAILSTDLINALSNSLKVGNQSLLLINRQGSSRLSLCAECKTPLLCPRCSRALVGSSEGNYRCIHCGYKSDIFVKCSACGSMKFWSVGLGTEKIENILEKIFPYARIARADTQSMTRKNSQSELLTEFQSGKIDILIGTQMISKGWNIPKLETVGVIDTDELFTFPDYATDERVFQLLMQVSGRVGRSLSEVPGRVFIQTFHPEKPIFTFLQERKTSEFLAQELETRKILKYPPYSHIIRLVGKHDTGKALEKDVEYIMKLLAPIISSQPQANEKESETKKEVNPLPCKGEVPSQARWRGQQKVPFQFQISTVDPFIKKDRNKYKKYILLKISNLAGNFSFESDDEQINLLHKTLEKIPKNWYVDTDPVNII